VYNKIIGPDNDKKNTKKKKNPKTIILCYTVRHVYLPVNCFVLGYSLIIVVTGEKNQEYNIVNNNWFNNYTPSVYIRCVFGR